MSHAVNIARIAALLAAVAVGVAAARLLTALESETRARESVTRQLPEILHAEADLMRRDVVAQIAAVRGDIRAEVSATRQSLETLLDTHAARIESEAVAEMRQTRRELLAETRPAVSGAVDLMAAYQAVPATVGARLEPWTECRGNGACWQSQITATLGATRATMGAVAKAAPGIAAAMDRSANSTEKATGATADAMRNIAEISRPLPRWVRVPLQILGPTTPLWLPFTMR